jgi:hypothetical protein
MVPYLVNQKNFNGLSQHRLDFLAGHDNGKALGLVGTDDFAQIAHFAAKDMAVEEQL